MLIQNTSVEVDIVRSELTDGEVVPVTGAPVIFGAERDGVLFAVFEVGSSCTASEVRNRKEIYSASGCYIIETPVAAAVFILLVGMPTRNIF